MNKIFPVFMFLLVSCTASLDTRNQEISTTEIVPQDNVVSNEENVPAMSHSFEPAPKSKKKIKKQSLEDTQNVKIESESVERPTPIARPTETTDNSKAIRMMIGMGLCFIGILIWIFNGKKQKPTV